MANSQRAGSENKGGFKYIADLLEKEMHDIESQSEKMLSEREKLKDHELNLKKREDLINMERLELFRQKQAYEVEKKMQNKEVEVHKSLANEFKMKNKDLENMLAFEKRSYMQKVEAMDRELLGLRKQLMDKEEEVETQNAMNQALTAKERSANDQLQEVRKELIESLESNPGVTGVIGVKRMGDIDELAFRDAIRRRLPVKGIREKSAELSSFWQSKVSNPNWYPFKMVTVEGSDNHQEILDPEDDNVKTLKMHLGDDACDVVIAALREMNEYNPSGRFPVPELWNFEENRKASLKEGVSHMDFQRKRFKRSSGSASNRKGRM